MTAFIIQLFKRVRSSSPQFFIKLRISMIVLGVLVIIAKLLMGEGIISVSPELQLTLSKVFTESLIVISTVTGVSFIPTSDANLIDNDVKNAVIKKAIDENDNAIMNNIAKYN